MTSRRLLAGLLALTIVAAACGSSDTVATTTTTPSEPPPTTAPSAEAGSTTTIDGATSSLPTAGDLEVVLGTCGDSGDFEILCEAYDILTREFVDPLDPAALAAGAAKGIEAFAATQPAGEGSGPIVCPLPTAEFDVTCQAAGAAWTDHTIGVDSIAQAAVAGMLDFGLDDPNSVYYTPSVIEQLDEERSGTISGIGSLVQTEEDIDGERQACSLITDTCQMRIVGVIGGGPAEAVGLLVGDIVVSVNGTSITGMTVDEIVGQVRGPEGTDVTLVVERDGSEIEYTITRAPIIIPVTESELLDGNIGYLKLSQFTNNSGQLFRDELESLFDSGATSLIIDFQNNPGGALNAAIDIASEFLGSGLVLRTESPEQERDYQVQSGGVATDPGVPVVVLVNGGSASASEVVAGVLQETGRATVMGTATFGKNTVQQQFGLSNGGAVKVTIARWVTPDRLDFGGDGLTPDVAVDVPPDGGEQFLIDAAVSYLTGA
jgi:carboxyl-terminal processing protease